MYVINTLLNADQNSLQSVHDELLVLEMRQAKPTTELTHLCCIEICDMSTRVDLRLTTRTSPYMNFLASRTIHRDELHTIAPSLKRLLERKDEYDVHTFIIQHCQQLEPCNTDPKTEGPVFQFGSPNYTDTVRSFVTTGLLDVIHSQLDNDSWSSLEVAFRLGVKCADIARHIDMSPKTILQIGLYEREFTKNIPRNIDSLCYDLVGELSESNAPS
jgi:hypothetical protein